MFLQRLRAEQSLHRNPPVTCSRARAFRTSESKPLTGVAPDWLEPGSRSLAMIHAGLGEGARIRINMDFDGDSPVFEADKPDCNVRIPWVGCDRKGHHFLAVRFAKPLPATFLWVISGILGVPALLNPLEVSAVPPLLDFYPCYYNQSLVAGLTLTFPRFFQGALALRYLNEISRISGGDSWGELLYFAQKTQNLIPSTVTSDEQSRLTKLLGLRIRTSSQNGYFFPETPPGIFSPHAGLKVTWADERYRNSSLWLRLNQDQNLPALPLPETAILIPTSRDEQSCGFAEFIPAVALKKKRDWRDEGHNSLQSELFAQENFHEGGWNTRWAILTPHPLDALLSTFMLVSALPAAFDRASSFDFQELLESQRS